MKHKIIIKLIFFFTIFALCALTIKGTSQTYTEQDLETSDTAGMAAYQKGDYSAMIEALERSVIICEQLYGKEYIETAAHYNNLGEAYKKNGEYDKAIGYYESALDIYKKTFGEKHDYIALSYNNLGDAYYNKGEYNKAIGFFEHALDIYKKTFGEKHDYVALSYNNLGIAWSSKYEYDKAIRYYKSALAIKLKVKGKHHPDVAISYNNLGTIYFRIKEYDKAIGFFKSSLAIKLKVMGKHHPDVAISYNNLGKVYGNKREYIKAIEFYKSALAINLKALNENHPTIASIYNNLGYEYCQIKEFDKALGYFKRAMGISKKTKSRYQTIRHSVILGYLHLERKEYKEAKSAFEEGISVIESGRTEIGTEKQEFMTRNIDTYYYSLKTCSEMNDIKEAFRISEAMKARGLLDRMTFNAALSVEGIIQTDKENLIKLNNEIESLTLKINTEIQKIEIKKNSEKFLYLTKEIEEKEKTFKELDQRLMENERYKNLRKPRIIELGEAEKLCIDGRAILEFTIWENNDKKSWAYKYKQSYCIIITNKGSELVQLNKEYPYTDMVYNFRTHIINHDALFMVYGKDASGSRRLFPINTVDAITRYKAGESYPCDTEYLLDNDGHIYRAEWKQIPASRNNLLISKTDTGYKLDVVLKDYDARQNDAANVSISLYANLVTPVEKFLAGKTKLTIVPDGALAFLPFDALRKNEKEPYLCETYSITLSPSVSVMQMVKGREFKSSRENFLGFGGALYDDAMPDENRLRRLVMRGKPSSQKEMEYYANRGAGSYYTGLNYKWNDLIYSKNEIVSIENDIYKKKNTKTLLGKDVTENQIKSLSKNNVLSQYKNIHFACHGYYNSDFPGLSAVVLSEVSGKLKNESNDDGYLTVEEVALLKLEADIVNLSACETGLGKEVKGDGVIGLTRAFQVAGANRVGVTLWNVADKAASDFMVSMYRKVEMDKKSFRDAYTETKREFILKKEYNNPYFWSSFILYGE